MGDLRHLLILSGLIACVTGSAIADDRPKLPERAPVPALEPQRPAIRAEGALPSSNEAPIPEQRPDDQPSTQEAGPGTKPSGSVGRQNATNYTKAPDAEASKADADCRAELDKLGVKYETQTPLSDPLGCSVRDPLSVSSLGRDIEVDPPAVMNCAMTEAAARFAQDTMSSTAKSIYGSELKAIANASAYVCRPRNGTRKLSEHAFGNALDMARFVLKDGKAIEVTETRNPQASEFLSKVRSAACGPFKTVLGPGSNADHAEHLHFDLQPRRSGSTFCE